MRQFQSIELISNALLERGYSMRKFRVDGHGHRVFQKGAKQWSTSYQYVQYPGISQQLKMLAVNKNLAYDYVLSSGHSTPKTLLVPTGQPFTSENLEGFHFPLITKPVDGSGSLLVSRNITTEDDLRSAIAVIHSTGSDALVQEQFMGHEIRLTVINNEVASAFLRDTANVVGDGKRTLAQLLEAENAARAEIRVPYMEYPQLSADIIEMPKDLTSIPADGERHQLGVSTMISGGASAYNIDATLHPSYRQLAIDMVAGLNTPFLVVDLLTHDFTQPALPDSYVFLEFNTSPALKLYYSFRDGKHFDIIPRLTDMIEATV